MITYIKILSAALLVTSATQVFASDDTTETASTHGTTARLTSPITVPAVTTELLPAIALQYLR